MPAPPKPGLTEHFAELVLVPPVVTVPEALAEAMNVASRCETYHAVASARLISASTTWPLQTMTPPVVALQSVVQTSGVVVQVVLFVTWHMTVHSILSIGVQLVAQLVAQSVVGGAWVHVCVHWAWQSVVQSVEDAAPQLLCAEHDDPHCALQ